MTNPATPVVIGLTGPIAAGKSRVAAYLAEHGALVLDGDVVYRELVAPPSPLLDGIRRRFGEEVIGADGGLNRAALGEIVFRDPQALADLEAITHPAVVADVRRRIAATEAGLVVVEAIKLVESGLADDADALWLVEAPDDVRLRRLMARNDLDEAAARTRLASARPALPAGVVPDVVIDNGGTWEDTQVQIEAALRQLHAVVREERTTPTGEDQQ
ncbi:MAG: dephospho-CoA kinase [Thermomicrobiales bacterium]